MPVDERGVKSSLELRRRILPESMSPPIQGETAFQHESSQCEALMYTVAAGRLVDVPFH